MPDILSWLLVGLPLLPLSVTLFNLATWRRGDKTRDSVQLPEAASVGVLIPARNEGANIAAAIDCVLSADSSHVRPLVTEVLVYDDGSTDNTAAIVLSIAAKDPRVRLISGTTLPSGWVGKPHACQRLFESAKSEILLFMDADVRLSTDGLARLLSLTTAPAAGRVVSAVPRQITGSFFERLVLPLLILTYTSWLPLRLIEKGKNPKTVAANGQLLLLSRTDCKTLGGFTQVRNEIVDDVAFCRHAKKNGLRVVFADGFHIASCRMYRSTTEVWRGFSKNLYEGLGGHPLTLLSVLGLYFGCFVLPYIVLFAQSGTSHTSILDPGRAAALVGVLMNVFLRAALAVRFRQPLEGILLHPLAVLVLCALAVNSLIWTIRGRIEWAGRSYLSRSDRTQDPV